MFDLKLNENKKIILISSYCDTEEKMNMLKKNVDILYENNFDIVIFTPFCLDDDIIGKVNYAILSKENPYTSYPNKSVGYWVNLNFEQGTHQLFKTENDYGWSSLIQYKNMLDLVISRDYDNYILMIYDAIIDNDIIEYLKNNDKTTMFPVKKQDGKVFRVGTQLMLFDKNSIKYFYHSIYKENYYKNNDVLENWVEKMTDFMNWNIHQTPITDAIQITTWIHQNIINNESTKMFLSTVDEKVAFYDVKKKIKIRIETDKDSIENVIESNYIMDRPFFESYIKIFVDDIEYDITKKIKSLNYSKIEKIE